MEVTNNIVDATANSGGGMGGGVGKGLKRRKGGPSIKWQGGGGGGC